MADVNRYDPDFHVDGRMEPCATGGFVRLSDYDALLADNQDLREQVNCSRSELQRLQRRADEALASNETLRRAVDAARKLLEKYYGGSTETELSRSNWLRTNGLPDSGEGRT